MSARRLRMPSQPLGYATDWANVHEGETWIYDGWPHCMAESTGRNKAALGELTPRKIKGPPWARGYEKDVNGVWYWINRRTQFGAAPYPNHPTTRSPRMNRIHPSNWVFILVMILGIIGRHWPVFLIGFVLFCYVPTLSGAPDE